MSVQISQNIKKEKAFIDINGNIINKNTKQIIEPNHDLEVIEKQQVVEQQTVVENKTLSIQEQIKEAEERVAQLKTLKKLRAEELKAELELLEQE